MPVSVSTKTRIEVYIPDRPNDSSYRRTLDWIADEFTFVRAGGATTIEGIDGRYLSVDHGVIVHETISVVYSDFPSDWSDDRERTEVLDYLEELRDFAQRILWREETILILAYPVFHVESAT